MTQPSVKQTIVKSIQFSFMWLSVKRINSKLKLKKVFYKGPESFALLIKETVFLGLSNARYKNIL